MRNVLGTFTAIVIMASSVPAIADDAATMKKMSDALPALMSSKSPADIPVTDDELDALAASFKARYAAAGITISDTRAAFLAGMFAGAVGMMRKK